jgi:hypothetical protein
MKGVFDSYRIRDAKENVKKHKFRRNPFSENLDIEALKTIQAG